MTAAIRKIDDFSTLMPEMRALFDHFAALGIVHDTYEHPPIFTVEEGLALDLPGHIAGLHGKTLFLTAKEGGLWLVVVPEDRRVDLKSLATALGVKRLSFAKPEEMQRILQVTPGSATPFAVMHDKDHEVRIVIDAAFATAVRVVFHPLRNTHSTAIAGADLFRFVGHFGFELLILSLA